MKSILITCLFAFFFGYGNGQTVPVVVYPFVYFSQEINIDSYAGKPFKLSASIRARGDSDSSGASMLVRIIKKGAGTSFSTGYEDNVVKAGTWQYKTINGMIDTAAKSIQIIGLCRNAGTYYFDDFDLQVALTPGTWKKIPIPNSGFENGQFDYWVAGFPSKPQDFDGADFAVEKRLPSNGGYALKIDFHPVPYGNNPQGQYADVNGIKLYYESYGAGKPLVLLHGNGGSIKNQAWKIAFFKRYYKVIAIDSRAQGKSTDDGRELTYDLMASDVNALLNQLQIDSAYFWGQSDGGIISLLMAMHYPRKTAKIALWGANIRADSLAFAPGIYQSVVKAAQNGTTAQERKLNTLMECYPDMKPADLQTIHCPALVMAGDKDAIRLQHTADIYAHIPGAALFIMPGASHYGSYEQPDLFNTVLLTFFEKKAGNK